MYRITNLNHFCQLQQQDRLPNHLLLVGLQEQLPQTVLKIAQSLLCPQNGNCHRQNCRFCLGVLNKHYETFFVLETETATIKKEDLNPLFRWIEHTQFNLHPRIYYVANLDFFTNTASNAFLKFLETTHHNCLGIFTTSNPQILLPTIRSRLQIFYLNAKLDHSQHQQFNINLTVSEQTVCSLLNQDLYLLDRAFILQSYRPVQSLVDQFLFLLSKNDLTAMYLLSESILTKYSFWLFLEVLTVNLHLILNNDYHHTTKGTFKFKKATLFFILDVTSTILYQNASLFHRTQSAFGEKNTFLYWMEKIRSF